MKLAEHVEFIRKLIDTAFRNRLGRMGITPSALQAESTIPTIYLEDRRRIGNIRTVLVAETGNNADAYEKLVEEFTFTLFNRLAALKVMEAHTLHPEIITRRSMHGDRSFAHKQWLEEHPDGRNREMEGLVGFIEDQLALLAGDIPLFSLQHPYHLLPTAIELNSIIAAFNKVETDIQVEAGIWKSDDVLGWLYESYNNYKKAAHKEGGSKTEYNKVSIQSQIYTPRWVVKFLVDNSLGKLYLEMYPDSDIKTRYKIANAPKTQTRPFKLLTEIKLIDPATGSGNFLLYAFDLFYDLYKDQIDNYGADYDDRRIAELIITHNLHGIDLDDRAIQIAQLGLYIKAKRKRRSVKIEHFNIVSSDFYLPEYTGVSYLFEGENIGERERRIIADIWEDLQNAYKFGALIRLEEKMNLKWFGINKVIPKGVITMFGQENLDDFQDFRSSFFTNLQKAVTQNTAKQGQNFLNTKTQDAITFLQLLTQKYDVAVANPPYTDSADFGPELKAFVDTNYRNPFKFNSNLYAAFIKRCFELIEEHGKMALIHPLTFMYIKSFEDVRKFILNNLHVNVFVDYGLSNLFGVVMVDPAFYVLEKVDILENSLFISLDQYTRTPNEKIKKDFCLEALNDYISNRHNKHNIALPQEKLKLIDGWPFIYWISDGFREKFKEKALDFYAKNSQGMSVSNGEKYQRFVWEVSKDMISINHKLDKKKWVPFAKGGPFNKWYGNNWLLVNWYDNGKELKEFPQAAIRNQDYYFLEGITYSSSGSKGTSFRHLPKNYLFSGGGPSITLKQNKDSLFYLMGFLNSKLSLYLLECLNPTVNTTQGDLNRIPFAKPLTILEDNISILAKENVVIKKQLDSFRIIDINFEVNPILAYTDSALRDRLLNYLNFENTQIAQVLLHEAIINRLVFKVYELSEEDIHQVETKMGKAVAGLPILESARKAYLGGHSPEQEIVKSYISDLQAIGFEEQQIQEIKSEFGSLYQSNNDLEEFCIRHQLNPINVWHWFKESRILPQARAAEIALEFLADAFRTILNEDEDGIVPLIGLPGEPGLMERFEEYCFGKGFTSAQIMQLDVLIGRPINEYVEHYFFTNLSDHLNLFMYLPKTPFIWHLSSGEHQGFEAYIIIYRWNKDSLYKLKSKYISKRTESLSYRYLQIMTATTAQAQTEKDKIHKQLQEIEIFSKKIDELIAEGYDPKLDDGVGKNIAPLQKKGMLKADVLNKKQLEKYLNADW